ncbi:MAG: Unknown protein [uncultured Sulfurovum sp.]|uniref:Uncharacterized protein n=1 Tax=uncultured Sulfurovum sp. TaxID=269237 RepID=A0A6S6U990_9BACT|nr:MAG: Unknown protein [uncultured Sulfurovum sp.]
MYKNYIYKLLKYFLVIVILILITLFYFFNTKSGQKKTYSVLSYYLTKKAGFDVEVHELALRKFPHVTLNVLADEKYTVNIDGYLENIPHDFALDLNFNITSNCISTKICHIDDQIDIKGKITGKPKQIVVIGKGNILDGTAHLSLKQNKKVYENVRLELHDVNSTKLLKLLDQKALFNGSSDAIIHFDYLSKKSRVGTISYKVYDKNLYGVPTTLNAQVNIVDDNHTFTINAISDDGALYLTNGHYNKKTKQAHALYTLDITKLESFKKLLKQKYLGPFQLNGKIQYDNKQIDITGVSKSLGGTLDLKYDKKHVDVQLTNIPFRSFMQRIDTDTILDANTSGNITYDLEKKEMLAKTTLENIQFIPSKFIESLKKKFNINLATETFDTSTINASYKDNTFSSQITLANDKRHLILTDTQYDSKKKALDTFIELKMAGQLLSGDLYARLDEYITDDLYLKFSGKLNQYYHLKLDGLINQDLINMDYTLNSERLPSHIVTIEDIVSIRGHLNGPLNRLRIRGHGQALDGNVNFDTIKKGSKFENVHVNMADIHAKKLFTLLGAPELPNGKANINLVLEYLINEQKKGTLQYTLKNAHYKASPLTFHANVAIENLNHTYEANATLGNADITLRRGSYNERDASSEALYTINTKDLSEFEELLGYKYLNALFTMGKVKYNNKKFQIRGLSKTFGGAVDYFYKDDMLFMDLESISLRRFMLLFPYPHILDATLVGNINYDFNEKKILLNTALKNTKFLPSDLVDSLYEKADVNLLLETFHDSYLNASYQNHILTANLKLQNFISHFYLSNAIVNTKEKTVNAFFDFKMQKQEFSGKIFGSLDHPEINLNIQKLIRYQMDKQFDTYMGKGNRQIMDSMPMGTTAKDVAAGMGAGFMGMFF